MITVSSIGGDTGFSVMYVTGTTFKLLCYEYLNYDYLFY